MTLNGLLNKSKHDLEAIEFNAIQTIDFVPALKKFIKEALDEVDRIVSQESVPDFENTIVALENGGLDVSDTASIFWHLFSAESDQSLKKLAPDISLMLSKYSSKVYCNKKLFKRIQHVFTQIEQFSGEDKVLLEKTYVNFIRNGAMLSSKNKTVLKKIDEQLASLSPKFSNNVLDAINSFEYYIEDKNQLDGLPDTQLAIAKEAAEKKKVPDSWLITLQAPSIMPILKFCHNRPLRKKIAIANAKKCVNDDYTNIDIIKNIISLKQKRAKLLGYETHADYTLERRMAKNIKGVTTLLDQLHEKTYKKALQEIATIKEMAKAEDGVTELMPWDLAYYSEKLKKRELDFDEESLRPYFKSENVIAGIFKIAKKLFGLTFEKRCDLPTYHQDVNVYTVYDENKSLVGLLYEDLFPRETKRSGAWMTQLRNQGMAGQEMRKPHVCFTCNFTKSTKDKPSLLTFNEVLTTFHEFGHCLHGLLSNCKYQSLAGTNVFWDFVELPSQIMENWCYEKECLECFAKHYETNEIIPDDLIEKIKKSKQFMAATNCMRQLQFAYLDMAWFTTNESVEDIDSFEDKVTKNTRLLPKIPQSLLSTSFSHIFAGGYSAGYYSYKWSEVLDADAFSVFKEKGIFNKEVADRFKEHILSKGGSVAPEECFKRFQGREPNINALLLRDGVLSE